MSECVSPEVLKKVRGWAPYVEAKLGFRNHWYLAGFSRDVEEQKPKPMRLLGEKILLNRIDGVVYAIKDRCLHRGVAFSEKIECLNKNTITCWYHGWTYRWDTGKLVDIITNPQSIQIGRHNLRSYPVREAKGLLFVYMGDREPTPLEEDLPPGFLDEGTTMFGIGRPVQSNWRLGVENGFDPGHIYIHKDSILVKGNDIGLPLGFAPNNIALSTRVEDEAEKPKGVYDLLGEHSMPVFDGVVEGEVAIEGNKGGKPVSNEISIWLPGILKVDPFPDPSLIQYEFYVPTDEDNHMYFQVLAKACADEEESREFEKDFHDKWVPLALHGFNDDDVWARMALQNFYEDDRGWTDEILFESDRAIVEWRRLASKHNRGLQSREHL